MTPPFSLRSAAHFERLFRKLLIRHSELREIRERVGEILSSDPYNRTHHHHIKKLEGVREGDGKYRLRIERFRFRYDIYNNEVILHSCGLRREDTYR